MGMFNHAIALYLLTTALFFYTAHLTFYDKYSIVLSLMLPCKMQKITNNPKPKSTIPTLNTSIRIHHTHPYN